MGTTGGGRRGAAAGARTQEPSAPARAPRDLQRTFQLVLATVWLFDAVLQLQPFMFEPGPDGFSGMLAGTAAGNPAWIGRSIRWNATGVAHHVVLAASLFALVQFAIAFGIAWTRTLRVALAFSIAWSLGVWWFGEGLGGVARGGATPFGGGPGAALLYALLAVVLWPRPGTDRPFVAARTLGIRAATAVWLAVWSLLAVLAQVGSGRSSRTLDGLVVGADHHQPGWLAGIDRISASVLVHHGAVMAVLLALVCVVAGVGVVLPVPWCRATLVLTMAVFAVVWLAVQDVGGILAGGATDPNTGPMVVLLAAAYWPLGPRRPGAGLEEPVVR